MDKIVKMLLASILVFGTLSFAQGLDLKGEGITLEYTDEYSGKTTTVITRNHDNICKDKTKVNGGDPEAIWGGDYANSSIPDKCKKTFVTTIGKISPMKIADGIETYGELEVIDFMKKKQTDKNLVLVDARMRGWYVKGTIPGAVNLSFKTFDPTHYDFEIVMDTAGVIYEEGVYDFKNAKTLLLFCNGVWCPQSTWAIENLLKIGYPKEKLMWYRGGMYSWKMLNLTTVKPL
jgi:rhodanese-related sulfurtransferase